MTSGAGRTRVFICYSHADRDSLERLRVFLRQLEREGLIDRWDDGIIKPGQKWREQISKAIDSSKVAVLLISQDFLSSEFITTDELPRVLAKAEGEGMVILLLILKHCLLQRTALSRFQAVNAPDKPLKALSKIKQEALWVELANKIIDAVTPASLPAIPSSDIRAF